MPSTELLGEAADGDSACPSFRGVKYQGFRHNVATA